MTIDELAAKLKLQPPDVFARDAEAANHRRGCPEGPKRRTGRTTRLLLEALVYADAGLRVCVVAESVRRRDALLRRALAFACQVRLRKTVYSAIQVTAKPPSERDGAYAVVLFDYSGPGRLSLRAAN